MEQVFSYIIGLGAAVMMPIIFTILGVCIGIKFSKALKSGLLVGVGFVGLSVVTALLTSSLGPALSKVVEIYGLQLKVFDMGWPAAAAVAYNTSVGAFIIPVCLVVNILMLLTKTTRTVNIDLWNYWHFAFIGAVVYFATDSILWGFFAAVICYIITLILADYTADKFQGFYDKMEGISIPQPFCAGFVPFALIINKVLDKIPGFEKLNIDAEGMKKKFGLLGEPLFLGILVGCGIGALSCKNGQEIVDKIPYILGLGIKMGAVMELIPRITSLFIEGLKPISDATRELIAKKFKGAVGLNIGMSPALVIGHPATLVVSLLLIPVTILLAVVLPGNEFLPLASLAGMFYVFPLILPITKGNVVKTFIIGFVVLAIGLYFVTDLAPYFTKAAHDVYAKTQDAAEYGVQFHNHPDFTRNLLAQINPEVVNERKLSGRFWEQYLKPSISRFREKLSALEPLEQAYFYTLYNFITKELYTSKSGDVDYEGRAGASALWLSTLDEKREAGEILYDLQIMENRASQAHKAYILLSIPQYDEMFLPNFRTGDVVVLYERNNDLDNATNKMVFKGNIEQITDTELRIRLRATQRNASVFSPDSRYAVEHDTMDTTFRSMYLGLSAFLDANTERRELLLGQRPPRFDSSFDEAIALTGDDFERVALKAESARDYFLLVGPPGTGKTSRALRRMVEHFYAASSMQILLLAYTNRAVDEICQSLSSITPGIDYIRVGSELSCDVRFRGHLLENILAECNSRREVNIRMADCRVYVGTVASIAAKAELFKLKRFDVAIVDEATQILEPQLLGILCAKFADERNAVGKFILIGDHKQLPAVILQNSGHSEVHDEGLREAGLFNLKDSLFERLYRFHLKEESPKAIDMLCRQGRMHPGVAFFPNKAFYAGKLEALGLPHQLEHIEAPVRFIPSKQDLESVSGKTNRYEAQIVAGLAKEVYLAHEEEFDPNRTLGVITPYRSQIALIRKELQALAIPALSRISIDTVERYQGSERDVIIYSFCVNHLYQLRFLPNLTEEDGVQIDRKLNVALTRARKQLFITGVPEILSHNSIYQYLLKTIY